MTSSAWARIEALVFLFFLEFFFVYPNSPFMTHDVPSQEECEAKNEEECTLPPEDIYIV